MDDRAVKIKKGLLRRKILGVDLSPQTAAGLEEWVEGAARLLGSA